MATGAYTVAMPVDSIRFSDAAAPRATSGRPRAANTSGCRRSPSASSDQGLRSEAHPLVIFRAGPTGRRPVLVGGPEVADVIGAAVGGDVPVDRRRARAAELLNVSETLVDAALAYYADFTDEIDALPPPSPPAREADEAEAAWEAAAGVARAVRLLLDEMHAPAVADALTADGWDVVRGGREPLAPGTSDEELLAYATAG